ncbi:MAG: hypothetical protein A2Y15_00695 [Clostridiales bacterium GWF2_36_10]|nr:MAG: hypothetical protein A2Y15_00695 [Clostridiales bacterium GWF2_36_10]HAN21514.1 hypothetical protein [Clostridiales bacterium]
MINQPTRYYGEVNIPKTEPTYWSEKEDDYGKEQNLILGLPQQIIAYATVDGNMATPQYNTPVTGTELTDGKYATEATYTGKGWFRFTRGMARSIIYDLKHICAVSGYSVGFLKENSTAVGLPAAVTFSATENGVDWQEIHQATEIYSEKESDIVRISGKFSSIFRARFIKITFTIYSHVYIDEIEIYGIKKVGDAKSIVPDKEVIISYPNKYATPAEFNNTHDVLLSYICHPKIKPITKEIYLPHVAYIENGQIKDTLFDSYMFLPYVAYLYEGHQKKALKKEDWQYYMDVQYIEGGNMDALEAAVGETKATLGKPDYKVSVFLSILYPVVKQKEFGEVDGKMLDFSKFEDRKTAIKWLIDEQIRVFNQKGYKNIYIQGFYWFTEEIDYSDYSLLNLIKFTTEYVRSLGFITSWIPYFQASGYNEWAKLGFDLACYQPNFAFNYTIPDQRLFDAADAAKLLGMCIELEIGGSKAEDVDRLKKYYAVGALTGYMTDALHMYYQGGIPDAIYKTYNSEDKYINSLYKDTYKFIKGKFNPSTPAAVSKSYDCTVSGSVNDVITVICENVVKNFIITTAPKSGEVTIDKNGNFIYTPESGFTGEDSFEVSVDYGYDASVPAKFIVKIK